MYTVICMSTDRKTPYFVYDLPKLQISEAEFTPRIPEGTPWKSSFTLCAEDGSEIAGRIVSDNRRIIPAADSFRGTRCEIVFGIDTKGLRPDEAVEGRIGILSSLSEYAVSVHAVITEAPDEDFDPSVRALEDFEKLCRRDMREGFRLFTHPAFPHILNGKNVVYLPLYKGLSRNPVTYQHLEEFLIASGKKRPVGLSLDKQNKAVYQLKESQKDILYIYKDNWGYVHIEVETEGDFLEVERRNITTDDFIGSICGLEYTVRRDKIGNGRAHGRIRLKTVHQELVYEIEASADEEKTVSKHMVRDRRTSWLMRDYLKLQLHEMDYRTWQDTSALTVGEMQKEDPSDVRAILYAAFLHYSNDDNSGTMETLWPVKEGRIRTETDEQRALYLWMAKRINLLPAEDRNILPELRYFYEKNPSSWAILYLIQQESEKKQIPPAARLQQMEECFDAGCNSPFLYLSAWELLSGEEALLRELTPFMAQVLCFGQKQGRMTHGLMRRAAFLATSLKQYSSPVFRLLSEGYRKWPDDEILEAVCQVLINGEPMKKECFPWYDLAIKRDLRITRLYEFYMETYDAPAEETIPQPVRMYFTTAHTLGDKKRALLYASVILHREEDETGYTNFARNMRVFAMESLRNGRIDKNYAVLYQHFFARPETREIAELMVRVLFAQRVTVSDKRIRRVIVCHNALKKEASYACKEGISYPLIYSEDACLFFEDNRQRRFAATVTCTKEPLFRIREIAQACIRQAVDDAGLELFLCREKAFQMDVNSRSVEDYMMAERNSAFTDNYRRIIRRKLMEYELAHPEREAVSGQITEDRIEVYAEADRAAVAQLLFRDGRYRDAFRVVSDYGYEYISPEILLRLATHIIQEHQGEFDEELMYLASYVFHKGRENETVLEYLQDHYEGTMAELCSLRTHLKNAGLDASALEEKILTQAVATWQFPDQEAEILRSQMDLKEDPAAVYTYLTYASGQYFLNGRKTDAGVFRCLQEALRQNRLEDDICSLAMLKFFAERGEFTDEEKETARNLLETLNGRGYRFAFYGQLPEEITQGCQIEGRTFIEEQLRPDTRVIIHYQIRRKGKETDEWTSESVPQMYNGIFNKEFTLFYGDVLTYYLRIMKNGAIQTTDKRTVSPEERSFYGKNRYALLNRMLKAQARGDEKMLGDLAEQYSAKEYAVQNGLSLIFGVTAAKTGKTAGEQGL